MTKPAGTSKPSTDPTSVSQLVPDPTNRRKRTARNVGMIVDALQHVGTARSIVIDEHNEILAGNGVIEAAQKAGITRVRVVESDGQTIIAVRRRGLTVGQKRDLAIYDNRAAELAEWDTEQIQADMVAGIDLSAFFDAKELTALLRPAAGDGGPGDVANQAVPGSFLVMVTCATEEEQIQLLERLMAEGLSCKAIVS